MAATKETIIVKIMAEVADFKAGLKHTEKNLDQLQLKSYRLGASVRSAADSFKKFDMSALSIMFTGMLIQRTFQKILTSTVDTFSKISQGSTVAGQAITALGAEFTYLKFEVGRAIGEALAPLMAMLVPIIRAVADWIQKNPRLTAAIVLLGFALGTLLVIGGNAYLFLQGLVQFLTGQFMTSLGAIAKSIGLSWATAFWPLIIIAAIVTAVIVAMIIAWQQDFGGFREWFKTFWDGIALFLDGIFTFIQGIWDIMIGLMTGDSEKFEKGWTKIWEGIVKMFKGYVVMFVSLWAMLGLALLNMTLNIAKGMKNLFIDYFITPFVKLFLNAINMMIEMANRILPDYMKLPTINVNKMADSIKKAIGTGVDAGADKISEVFKGYSASAISGLKNTFGIDETTKQPAYQNPFGNTNNNPAQMSKNISTNSNKNVNVGALNVIMNMGNQTVNPNKVADEIYNSLRMKI